MSKGIQAPDLTGFGNRTTIAGFLPNDKESLVRWLRDPQSLKPGTEMPAYNHLDDQEDGCAGRIPDQSEVTRLLSNR